MNRLQKRNSRKRLEKTGPGSGRTALPCLRPATEPHFGPRALLAHATVFPFFFFYFSSCSSPCLPSIGASPSGSVSGGRPRAGSASGQKSRLAKGTTAKGRKGAASDNSPLMPPHMAKGLQHDHYEAAVAHVRTGARGNGASGVRRYGGCSRHSFPHPSRVFSRACRRLVPVREVRTALYSTTCVRSGLFSVPRPPQHSPSLPSPPHSRVGERQPPAQLARPRRAPGRSRAPRAGD